jgi:hypothetical protein
MPPPPPPQTAMTQADRLSSRIAHQEKLEEVKLNQYSTPSTAKPPVFENKLSPIDKIEPIKRINTQILVPIKENSSFDEQSQIKRRKIDDNISALNSKKEHVCLSNIDDIQPDDLEF